MMVIKLPLRQTYDLSPSSILQVTVLANDKRQKIYVLLPPKIAFLVSLCDKTRDMYTYLIKSYMTVTRGW